MRGTSGTRRGNTRRGSSTGASSSSSSRSAGVMFRRLTQRVDVGNERCTHHQVKSIKRQRHREHQSIAACVESMHNRVDDRRQRILERIHGEKKGEGKRRKKASGKEGEVARKATREKILQLKKFLAIFFWFGERRFFFWGTSPAPPTKKKQTNKKKCLCCRHSRVMLAPMTLCCVCSTSFHSSHARVGSATVLRAFHQSLAESRQGVSLWFNMHNLFNWPQSLFTDKGTFARLQSFSLQVGHAKEQRNTEGVDGNS